MSDESFKVQVSITGLPRARYHKGLMINLRGDSVAEVEDQIDAAASLIEKAGDLEAVLTAAAGLGAKTESVSENKSDAPPWNNGQTAAPQGNPNARVCPDHNTQLTYKSGNKNGKSWAGWFCEVKGCRPQWVNSDN